MTGLKSWLYATNFVCNQLDTVWTFGITILGPLLMRKSVNQQVTILINLYTNLKEAVLGGTFACFSHTFGELGNCLWLTEGLQFVSKFFNAASIRLCSQFLKTDSYLTRTGGRGEQFERNVAGHLWLFVDQNQYLINLYSSKLYHKMCKYISWWAGHYLVWYMLVNHQVLSSPLSVISDDKNDLPKYLFFCRKVLRHLAVLHQQLHVKRMIA